MADKTCVQAVDLEPGRRFHPLRYSAGAPAAGAEHEAMCLCRCMHADVSGYSYEQQEEWALRGVRVVWCRYRR